MNNFKQSVVGVSGFVKSQRRDRDRFVALAFCAADLLLEVNASREIIFAAGAFHSLIGKPPESLVVIRGVFSLIRRQRAMIAAANYALASP